MDQQQPTDAAALAAAQAGAQQSLVLRLYVAGASRRSTQAITMLLSICEEHFAGRYQLEILDIYQHTKQAQTDAILATPTLLLIMPGPTRHFIGDFQQPDRLLAALGVGGGPQSQRQEHSDDTR
jgi:circadian clock protein KaiB